MSKKLRKEARLIERLFLGGQWTPFIARWSQAMGNKALHNRQSWIEITCRRYVQLTLLVETHNNNPLLAWPAIFNALLSSAPSWTLQCFWCHYSSPIPSNGPIKWTFHGLWIGGSYVSEQGKRFHCISNTHNLHDLTWANIEKIKVKDSQLQLPKKLHWSLSREQVPYQNDQIFVKHWFCTIFSKFSLLINKIKAENGKIIGVLCVALPVGPTTA